MKKLLFSRCQRGPGTISYIYQWHCHIYRALTHRKQLHRCITYAFKARVPDNGSNVLQTFSVGVGAFVIGLGQISSFLSSTACRYMSMVTRFPQNPSVTKNLFRLFSSRPYKYMYFHFSVYRRKKSRVVQGAP